MSPTWEDLNARVRGLSGHLLDPARLRALAGCRDLEALARELEATGDLRPGPEATVSPAAFDRAVRRVVAARLRVLARWSGPRAETLAALFEDEDRRSLRGIFRGAVAATAPEPRLAAAVPTPSLPERALVELARQPTAAAAAALLTSWGNPYGSAAWPEARRPQPDLFALELALSRTFADRARRSARHAGRDLERYVEDTIDLENVWSALGLAEQGDCAHTAECFLEGGRHVDRDTFVSAVESKDAEAAAGLLRPAFAETPFETLLHPPLRDRVTLENAALRIQIRGMRRAARIRPLGVAPVVGYWLRLRAETRDLRRLIWGIVLDAPRSELTEGLVAAG